MWVLRKFGKKPDTKSIDSSESNSLHPAAVDAESSSQKLDNVLVTAAPCLGSLKNSGLEQNRQRFGNTEPECKQDEKQLVQYTKYPVLTDLLEQCTDTESQPIGRCTEAE